MIGKGAQGEVRLYQELTTGQQHAIKVYYKAQLTQVRIDFALNEIRMMRKLQDCDHVVHLDSIYEDEEHIYIVMGFLQDGCLLSQIT